MILEARELGFADVTFLQKLQESKNSVVFKVLVHGTTCVMKVYHDRGPSEHDPPDQEVNLFVCESTAYWRLKAKGLCDRGVVPDFYGTITNIQPTLWPSLQMFLGDKLSPNAILIEYIPNMQPIDLDNFSSQYLRELSQKLEDIHLAGVLHGDPKPRNMMISRDQGRVLWIDFDSAQTFSESLSTRQRTWIEEENEMMHYFAKALAQDYEEGELRHAYSYYYDWFV
ncbi:hypothetical protein PITC_036280 [Penicillium italicum]|uniref:Protein kinase domain-containing protein n=1 Tax=Penicillium italicum TaxID=40296 RepID=A0A0A2LPS1_PENIT|nr:hypothetical protein PITC_036280 [Penicillium italicum]